LAVKAHVTERVLHLSPIYHGFEVFCKIYQLCTCTFHLAERSCHSSRIR